MSIALIVPLIDGPDGRKPDLPDGLEYSGFRLRPDGQSYDVDATGPPELVAGLAIATNDEPISVAVRVVTRVITDRLNDLCRRTGHDDLVLVEPEAISVIEAALAAGLGRSGPRPDKGNGGS